MIKRSDAILPASFLTQSIIYGTVQLGFEAFQLGIRSLMRSQHDG